MALVRDKEATKKRVAEELSGRSNIHVVEADLTDYDAVKVRCTPSLVRLLPTLESLY